MNNKIAIAALLVVMSCSSGQIMQIDNDFPVVCNLDDYEIIDIPDFIDDLKTNGKYIVYRLSSKLSDKDQLACLIDTRNNFKQYFIGFGRGPGETTNILDLSFYDEKTVLACVDLGGRRIIKKNSLIGGRTAPVFTYRLANGQYAFPNIVKISDSVLYCGKNMEDVDNSTNWCIEDIASGKIRCFGEYPDNDMTRAIPAHDYSRQTAYQTPIALSPNKKHAVAYFFYTLGFDILDVEKARVSSSHVYSPLGVEVRYNDVLKANFVSKDPGALRGFLEAAVTERYIYLLASLKKFEDDNYASGREVYRYFWDGTPDRHFHLNLPTCSIAVSSDDKTLYAIKNGVNHDSLVKYVIE